MGVSKVTINGDTLIDITSDTVNRNNLLVGYTAHGADGQIIQGSYQAESFLTQTKTITPSENVQSVIPDSGYNGLSTVTVNGIPNTYIGSNIPIRNNNDLNTSGATVSVPEGYYNNTSTIAVSTTTQADINITFNSQTGNIAAEVNQQQGYVLAGTKTNTCQLTTQSGSTITPTKTQQSVATNNKYVIGDIVINAIPNNYIDTSDATAQPSQVLIGKTFYKGGEKRTGTMPLGSVTVPDTTISTTPNISINNNGLITAFAGGETEIEPEVNLGYISSGNPGIITVSGNNTLQLSTQGSTNITPTTASQIAVPAGRYTTGNILVEAIPPGYIDGDIQQKTASDIIVSGASVTIPAGYYGSTITKNVSTATTGNFTGSTLDYENAQVLVNATQSAGFVEAWNKNYTVNLISSTQSNPNVTINSNNGLITATLTQNAGFVPASTKTGTLQLSTQSATVITPSTVSQIAASAGKYLTGDIIVDAIPAGTVPSGVTIRTDTDITISGATVTVPSGYYENTSLKTVPSGSAITPNTTITASPNITINNSGLINAIASTSINITPNVSPGYISEGTSGTVTINGSNTLQLSTQGSTTITPSSISQTVVTAGKYTTGNITVAAIPNNYIVPAGTLDINTNGTVSVSQYSDVNVDVPVWLTNVVGEKLIIIQS